MDVLVKEHEKLRGENERLAAARVQLTQRLKEANDKVRVRRGGRRGGSALAAVQWRLTGHT